MAHGRTGPDIVMTTRYVGASAIRAVTEHETHRTPDGSSAIDPLRSHLNEILHGPKTQQEAVDQLWDKGVKKPAKQAENPFVQIVISASPDFFRGDGQGPGEWDQEKLKAWKDATLAWLRKEYGRDLAHVSLHLDEETPHMHILLVPTYDKAPRKPGRIAKGESEVEFAARKAAAENAEPVRTVGRSSNAYWKRNYARRIARQSYHEAVAPLGLGYGKDFVGEDEPSPERKTTGAWVREQAAKVREDQVAISEKAAALENREKLLDAEKAAFSEKKKQHLETISIRSDEIKSARADVDAEKSALEAIRQDQDQREHRLDQREKGISAIIDRVKAVFGVMSKAMGIRLPAGIYDAMDALEGAVETHQKSQAPKRQITDPFLVAQAQEPADDPGPGL